MYSLTKSQFYHDKIIILNSTISIEPLKVKIIRRLVESNTADVYKAMKMDYTCKNPFVVLKRFKGERGRKLGENESINLQRIRNVKSLENNSQICHLLGYREEENSEEYTFTICLEVGGIQTLHDVMKRKKLNSDEINTFAEDMILLFSHFQKMGLFYRDIKPGNVFYNSVYGKIDKVIDFDISVWLEDIPADDGNNYMLNLAGTPKYMAPELYAIYLKLRKAKADYELDYDTKNLVVSNVLDQLAISQNRVEEYDEEKTLQITRKEIKIDEDIEMNSTVSASECFKMDVFSSLGLVILELALLFPNVFQKEVRIQEINRNRLNLEEAWIEFNRLNKNHNLKDLLDKMLVWEQKERWDFIELEDYLVYEKSLDLMDKYNYLKIEQKFTSISTFRDIWDTKNANDIQSHFFSIGYLAKKPDKKYIKTLLATSSEPYYLDKVATELIPSHLKYLKENFTRGIILIYTLDEGDFYKNVNYCLGKNMVDKYKYYLAALLKIKNQLVKPIFPGTVIYRVILLDRDPKWKFEARNQYFPGINLYWPSITSCTMSPEVAENWIRTRGSKSENSNIILFIITLNPNNIYNKIDISKYSKFPDELEVLLLPYFSFRVIRNQPFKRAIKGKSRTICQIEVEERDLKVFNFWVVWFINDENYMINSRMELEISILRRYGNLLKKFTRMEDAANFLEKFGVNSIVIVSGKEKEIFLERIKGIEVVKVLLFVENKYEFFNFSSNYEICGSMQEIMRALPDPDIFY